MIFIDDEESDDEVLQTGDFGFAAATSQAAAAAAAPLRSTATATTVQHVETLDDYRIYDWYREWSREDAEHFLADLPSGSFVVRPSRLGYPCLSHRLPAARAPSSSSSAPAVGHGVLFYFAPDAHGGGGGGWSIESERRRHASVRDLLLTLPLRHTMYESFAVTLKARAVKSKRLAKAALANSAPAAAIDDEALPIIGKAKLIEQQQRRQQVKAADKNMLAVKKVDKRNRAPR